LQRLGLYVADNWKVKPNLSATVALRYSRMTGRSDSDFPAIPELKRAIAGSR